MTHRYTCNVEYNPLKAIVIEIESGITLAFDIVPASGWQDETPEGIAAWDSSQNMAWTIAEGICEYLEAHPEVNLMIEGSKEVWQRVRSQWYKKFVEPEYPPAHEYRRLLEGEWPSPDSDHEVDLEEAKREWDGLKETLTT